MKRLWFVLTLLLAALVGCNRSPSTATILSDRDFTGFDVRNDTDKSVGQVASTIFDIEEGTVKYVIVQLYHAPFSAVRGASLEPRGEFVVLPWNTLRLNEDERALQMEVDVDTVDHAPHFRQPPTTTVADWDTEVREYWDEH